MSLTRAERETVIRYSDDPSEGCSLYTASQVQARRWRKLGYDLIPMGARDGWKATVTSRSRQISQGGGGKTGQTGSEA